MMDLQEKNQLREPFKNVLADFVRKGGKQSLT